MRDSLELVSKYSVLVFVVTCMATAGLGLSIRDMLAPFRRARVVAIALVANFVVVPGIAWLLTRIVSLQPPHAVGLLLLGGAAGAPFLPKLAELAKGDIAFSVGLMLLLMLVSVVFMPVALPLLITGLSAEPWPLLKPLLFTMLLPLALGMAVKNLSERGSGLLRPVFARVSNLSMILTVALLIGLNFEALIGTIGSGAIGVGLLFVALAFQTGWLLGGPVATTRVVVGLGTGQRNVAAALLIATQNFPDEPGVVIMLLVTTLAGLVVLIGSSRFLIRGAT